MYNIIRRDVCCYRLLKARFNCLLRKATLLQLCEMLYRDMAPSRYWVQALLLVRVLIIYRMNKFVRRTVAQFGLVMCNQLSRDVN